METSTKIPFHALINQNEAGIFYLEKDKIIFANPAFSKILKTNLNLIVNSSLYDYVNEEDLSIIQTGIEQLLTGKIANFSYDLKLTKEPKIQRYFSVHLKLQEGEENANFIIGSSREATNRVQKFEELTVHKSYYSALYDNILDGIFIYDYIKEQVQDCNSSAIKIFGYETKEEILGLSRFEFVPQFSSVFPNVDFHDRTKYDGVRIRNGEAFKTPGVFIKKNGDHMIVHANVVPTFRNPGEAFIIFQDSTDRVVLKNQQKSIQKKYKEIFENSHDAIVYTNSETRVPIICNQNALNLFGVTSFEEFANLRPKDFLADKMVDGLTPNEFYRSKIQNAFDNGKDQSQFWLKKKTGEIIRVEVIIICGTDNRKTPNIISFFRDVTSLFEARKNLNQKNDELKKYIDSNLQLENFAYFASHDLQTPLRSMISFTQLLKKSMSDDITPKQQEFMDFIISSSLNMRDLINDLLSYSRLNTTAIKITKIKPSELLSTVVKELDADIEAKQAEIVIEDLPVVINGDYTKLKQVFQNLISNAIKFSDTSKKPLVQISGKEEDQFLTFSIKDNGIGIDPQFHDKIFLLFKRLHTNLAFKGTGIGLAMVKKVIEQHEGKIWLESSLNEGTTFYFTLKKDIQLKPSLQSK